MVLGSILSFCSALFILAVWFVILAFPIYLFIYIFIYLFIPNFIVLYMIYVNIQTRAIELALRLSLYSSYSSTARYNKNIILFHCE